MPTTSKAVRLLTASLALVLAASPAAATTYLHRNIAELIGLAEEIVVGEVVAVEDGFDAGLPYTEIRLDVTETVRGSATETLTFRQFGLLAPRAVAGGHQLNLVSPVGWPRFVGGEKVLLFLYRPAARTGLQTTVGLEQGKFTIDGKRIANRFDNVALFRGVQLPRAALDEATERLLAIPAGPLPTRDLLAFVRRAVARGWFD